MEATMVPTTARVMMAEMFLKKSFLFNANPALVTRSRCVKLTRTRRRGRAEITTRPRRHTQKQARACSACITAADALTGLEQDGRHEVEEEDGVKLERKKPRQLLQTRHRPAGRERADLVVDLGVALATEGQRCDEANQDRQRLRARARA
eukprot:845821-Rhodomonas_salina.1